MVINPFLQYTIPNKEQLLFSRFTPKFAQIDRKISIRRKQKRSNGSPDTKRQRMNEDGSTLNLPLIKNTKMPSFFRSRVKLLAKRQTVSDSLDSDESADSILKRSKVFRKRKKVSHLHKWSRYSPISSHSSEVSSESRCVSLSDDGKIIEDEVDESLSTLVDFKKMVATLHTTCLMLLHARVNRSDSESTKLETLCRLKFLVAAMQEESLMKLIHSKEEERFDLRGTCIGYLVAEQMKLKSIYDSIHNRIVACICYNKVDHTFSIPFQERDLICSVWMFIKNWIDAMKDALETGEMDALKMRSLEFRRRYAKLFKKFSHAEESFSIPVITTCSKLHQRKNEIKKIPKRHLQCAA